MSIVYLNKSKKLNDDSVDSTNQCIRCLVKCNNDDYETSEKSKTKADTLIGQSVDRPMSIAAAQQLCVSRTGYIPPPPLQYIKLLLILIRNSYHQSVTLCVIYLQSTDHTHYYLMYTVSSFYLTTTVSTVLCQYWVVSNRISALDLSQQVLMVNEVTL